MNLSWGALPSFSVWLSACFILGLLLAAKCLLQMAIRRSSPVLAVEILATLAALGVATILGLDAFVQGSGGSLVATTYLPVATIALGLAFVAAHLGVSLLLSWRRRLALEPVAWLAVALTLAASVWSAHRHSATYLEVEVVKASYFAGDVEIQQVRSWVAVTDRGRELPLFRFDSDATETGDGMSSPANCHGWVFGNGQYFLECEVVEQILADNGYQPCQSPQAGDVIVYRNASGGISHTGVVKTTTLVGPPNIESKWGVRGRFVHPPNEQPYGSHYTYYRSTRQGHALAIRPAGLSMSLAIN